jgi:hypothetical protein
LWASLAAFGWFSMQPSPAPAQAPVWEPQLTHVQGLTELRRIFYSGRNGSWIVIHGNHLMPVVMDKDGDGREVRVALRLYRMGDGFTAWFEGRAGSIPIYREYLVRIGHSVLRLEDGNWTDSTIIGRIPEYMPAGDYPLTILGWTPRGEYTSVAVRSELRVHVIPADEDGDGHEKIVVDVDGDDCDDHDRRRYPGAPEVADFEGHDEDCDPATIGILDNDGDGQIDSRVCNWTDPANALCGSDCDDERRRVYQGEIETCDDLDNDCNGIVDDNLISCKSSLAGTRRPIPGPTDANRPEPEIIISLPGAVMTTFPAIDGCKCK